MEDAIVATMNRTYPLLSVTVNQAMIAMVKLCIGNEKFNVTREARSSVASLLAAIINQGNLYMNHKLLSTVSTEIHIRTIAAMLLHID